MKKIFCLGDVLSLTTPYLLSPNGITGVYEILNFLHQDSLFTHQLPRAREDALPWLRECVAKLFAPEIEAAIKTDLLPKLEDVHGSKADKIVSDYLARLIGKYGNEFELSPIPQSAELHRDPIEEAEEMAPGRVLAVNIAEERPEE